MDINISASHRLIIALDVDTKNEALSLVEELGEDIDFYKVGWQLFIREGMDFVKELIGQGKQVFLDLKMGDIEETIRNALESLPGTGIELLTIHGNGPTVEAAKKGRNGSKNPRLLMLTALSSQDDVDMRDLFSSEDIDIHKYVVWKAKAALESGCEGLIASGESVRELREMFDDDYDFLIVTPGIRPEGFPKDDHKRSLTPYQAIIDGADYLVVGRPITQQSHDPKGTAEKVISEIQRALDDKAQSGTDNSGVIAMAAG